MTTLQAIIPDAILEAVNSQPAQRAAVALPLASPSSVVREVGIESGFIWHTTDPRNESTPELVRICDTVIKLFPPIGSAVLKGVKAGHINALGALLEQYKNADFAQADVGGNITELITRLETEVKTELNALLPRPATRRRSNLIQRNATQPRSLPPGVWPGGIVRMRAHYT